MVQPILSRGGALAAIGALAALAAGRADAAPAARADIGPALTQVIPFDTYRPVVSVTFAANSITAQIQVADSQTSSQTFSANAQLGSTFAFPPNSKPLPPPTNLPPRTITITATDGGQAVPLFPLGVVGAGFVFGVNPRRQPTGGGQSSAAPFDAYVLLVAGDTPA